MEPDLAPARKEIVMKRIKLLEAELNGALEATAEEVMPMGDLMPQFQPDGMIKTIRDLEREIEVLRTEYERL